MTVTSVKFYEYSRHKVPQLCSVRFESSQGDFDSFHIYLAGCSQKSLLLLWNVSMFQFSSFRWSFYNHSKFKEQLQHIYISGENITKYQVKILQVTKRMYGQINYLQQINVILKHHISFICISKLYNTYHLTYSTFNDR